MVLSVGCAIVAVFIYFGARSRRANAAAWAVPIVVLAVVPALAVIGVAASMPGPSPGFRDFKWGDKPEGMVKVPIACRTNTTIEMERYWPVGDLGHYAKPSVGGRNTSDISYCFYKQQLCRVEIGWEHADTAAADDIAKQLSQAWGKADAESEGRRIWNSEDRNTAAMLLPDASDDSAQLLLASTSCAREVARDAAGL